MRPADVTEIHVYRVILQSSRDQNACTRSVTRTGPMSDPFQTLKRIIDEWWDLELDERDPSWMLSPVHSACTWSSTNDSSSAAYVLTRKGNPFHLLRPHGVLEVVWGHWQWTTAIALRKWINNHHCQGLFAQVCGPILTSSCAMWCDNTRLSEELIECQIGSFVQVTSRLIVRPDQDWPSSGPAAVHPYIAPPSEHSPWWPGQNDCLRPARGHMFLWVQPLIAPPLSRTGRRLWWKKAAVYPGKNPDTMIFHRVHKSIEEVCPVFEPAVKHFILADSEEQEHTRIVVFAIFTARFEFFGACHWTPVTQVWDVLDLCGGERGWIIYHNNQRLQHQKKSWFTRGISLPVMSDVTATPRYWRIARVRMLPRGGWLMPRCLYLVKRRDPPPLRPQSVMLQTVPQLMPPLLSKTQETLCSSLEDEAVAAAVTTAVCLLIWVIFNRQVAEHGVPAQSRAAKRRFAVSS